VAVPAAAGFVAESGKVTLDANGDGAVATTKRTGEAVFVGEFERSKLVVRKEAAYRFGVSQLTLAPFEDGVVEYGNMASSPQWDSIALTPVMPKKVLRKAFEELGAKYALFWQLEGSDLKVKAEYESPSDKKTTGLLRGDGSSFTKISRGLVLDADGTGPVAEALKTNKEVTVTFADGVDQQKCASMKRAAAAQEFGICSITFVPVIDSASGIKGVLEFGTSNLAQMNKVTQDCTLRMQAESVGAGYSIYWRRDGSKAFVEATYTSDSYRTQIKSSSKDLSFAEASSATTFALSGDSPVAEVMRTGTPAFIPDLSSSSKDSRSTVAKDYLVGSVSYVPVLGGVMEYGATGGKKMEGA
jgi:hypothetical protein